MGMFSRPDCPQPWAGSPTSQLTMLSSVLHKGKAAEARCHGTRSRTADIVQHCLYKQHPEGFEEPRAMEGCAAGKEKALPEI